MKSVAKRIIKWIIWGDKEEKIEEEMERREDEAFKYGEPPEKEEELNNYEPKRNKI